MRVSQHSGGGEDQGLPWALLTFPFLLQFALGFKAAHLEGVELKYMGQQLVGQYPIHFHLAGDLDEQGGYDPPTYIRDLSIHHTFSRCVTVHGSNGLLVSACRKCVYTQAMRGKGDLVPCFLTVFQYEYGQELNPSGLPFLSCEPCRPPRYLPFAWTGEESENSPGCVIPATHLQSRESRSYHRTAGSGEAERACGAPPTRTAWGAGTSVRYSLPELAWGHPQESVLSQRGGGVTRLWLDREDSELRYPPHLLDLARDN